MDIESIYHTGKEFALRRISRRECSSEDIRRHLRSREIPEEIIFRIISRLVEFNLIDDLRFSKMKIREQANRGKGPLVIVQKLRQYGIRLSVNQVQEFMNEVSDRSEFDAAREFVNRRFSHLLNDRKEASRALQALLRRGFSYSLARDVLSSFSAK